MTRETQEELLFEFVKWLREEYQIEDVYGMYVPEFLDDVVLRQPDVIGSFCLHKGCKRQSTCGDYCGTHCNCRKKAK